MPYALFQVRSAAFTHRAVDPLLGGKVCIIIPLRSKAVYAGGAAVTPAMPMRAQSLIYCSVFAQWRRRSPCVFDCSLMLQVVYEDEHEGKHKLKRAMRCTEQPAPGTSAQMTDTPTRPPYRTSAKTNYGAQTKVVFCVFATVIFAVATASPASDCITLTLD